MRLSISELVSRLRVTRLMMLRNAGQRDFPPVSDIRETKPSPAKQISPHMPKDDHHLRRSQIF